jgi:hypothetical protein
MECIELNSGHYTASNGIIHRTPSSNSVCFVCCRKWGATYGLVLFVVMPYDSLVFVYNPRNIQKLGPICSEYRSILPVLSSSNR